MNHASFATLDLNLLVVLDAILETGSVTGAAARLGLSQPAVSNAVGRLRRQLGDPILVRGPRGMVPTPRASALQAPLREALRSLHAELFEERAFAPSRSTRTFVVAGTDYVHALLLGPLVRLLRAAAPGVTLRAVPITSRFPWRDLETGDLDLAVGRAPTRPEGLRSRALFRDRIICLLAKDHPDAKHPLTLERYLALDHIDVLPIEAPGLADVYLDRIGRQRRVVATMPHFLVAPLVVRQAEVCLTLSERLARMLAGDLELVVRELPFPAPPFAVHAHWHERMHDDAGHRFLRLAVHQALGELHDDDEARPAAGRERARPRTAGTS